MTAPTLHGADLLFAVLEDIPVDRRQLAEDVAEQWRDALNGIRGQEYGVAALDRVLAALRGETDPRKLGVHGLRITLQGATPPPAHDPDQLQLG